MQPDVIESLLKLLPNLQEVDFSGLEDLPYPKPTAGFLDWKGSNCCPGIRRIALNGSESSIDLSGRCFMRDHQLKELSLDGSCLQSLFASTGAARLHSERSNWYLFMHCKSLERLSIKGVT